VCYIVIAAALLFLPSNCFEPMQKLQCFWVDKKSRTQDQGSPLSHQSRMGTAIRLLAMTTHAQPAAKPRQGANFDTEEREL
jgi:hypothetical protein